MFLLSVRILVNLFCLLKKSCWLKFYIGILFLSFIGVWNCIEWGGLSGRRKSIFRILNMSCRWVERVDTSGFYSVLLKVSFLWKLLQKYIPRIIVSREGLLVTTCNSHLWTDETARLSLLLIFFLWKLIYSLNAVCFSKASLAIIKIV